MNNDLKVIEPFSNMAFKPEMKLLGLDYKKSHNYSQKFPLDKLDEKSKENVVVIDNNSSLVASNSKSQESHRLNFLKQQLENNKKNKKKA